MKVAVCRRGEVLVPVSEEDRQFIRQMERGEVHRFEFSAMRNGAYFRKWWALVNVAFERWKEHAPPREHEGHAILPNFDRFRKDLTILAGFYEPTYGTKGVRLEPRSLRWSRMTEAEFDQLYSKTIDAILANLPGWIGTDRDALIAEVQAEVMEFA